MKTLKGLELDKRPSDVDDGYYVFGKNGLQSNINEAITNEDGFVKLDIKLKYSIIGTVEINNLVILFSTNNIKGNKLPLSQKYSEIGVLDTTKNTYTTIVDDSVLNYKFGFSSEQPIKGEAQKNYNNETIVVWKNNLQPPFIINIDNNKAGILDDYLLFPTWKTCSIAYSILSGGSLEKGAYTPVFRYIKNGVYTDYFNHGKTIYTTNDNNSQINIRLTNLDKNYTKIQVAIVSIVNGLTKVVTLAPVLITDVLNISYFGVYESEISFESLYTITPYYNKVKAITQLNDELFLANLEEQNMDKINYYMQVAALKTKLKWKSTLLSEVVGNKGVYNAFDNKDYTGGKYKSFAHQEVYAFYLVAVLKNGRKTKGYITTNRIATDIELTNSLLTQDLNLPAKVFQIEDTVSNVGFVERTGDFGYWENQNEIYPTDVIKEYGNPFASVLGQKVRHFKTPSHNFCYNNFYIDTNLNYGTKDLDILSVFVDSFVIPVEIINDVVGIELYYAKRKQTDITNLGQSLVLVGSKQGSASGNPIDISSTGGNFNYKGYSTDGNSSKEMIMEQRILRFHSFDMLNNNFSVKPDLLINQLKLKKTLSYQANFINNNSGYSEENFEGVLNDKGDFNTVFYKERSFYQVIDYTTGKVKAEVSNPSSTNKIRRVTNCKYTLNNSYFGDVDNRLLETCYTATLSSPTNAQFIKIEDNDQTIGGNESFIVLPKYELTYLGNLVRVVNNVFTNFNNQTLINADIYFTDTYSPISFNGDMFISDYSFVTYGRRDYYDRVFSAQGGSRFIHRFICETASNINLRYQKTGDIYSNFYPKSDGKFIRLLDKNLDPNNFGYDREFNSLYEENITCFNPSDEPKYVHPFRIIKSSPNQKEKSERSWRNFLPLDYHESDKSYDEILNLQGLNDKLLIHHKNALFVTRDKAKLNTDSLSVTLGAGDIFEFNPIKALEYKLGFGGINGDLGAIVTPLGYHFYKDGRPFIYGEEGLKSMSNRMFNFFMIYLQEHENNPYSYNGIVFGYDNTNRRFLMTVKSDKSYTLSYSIDSDNWVFFHDYIPDYYVHSMNNLYSIYNNEIYINSGGRKGIYYTQEVKPFFIDVVFNYEKEMILDSITWISENINNYLKQEVDNEFNTLTHISIRTSQQHSGRIKLYENNWHDKNYSKREGYFSFNEFKNIVKRITHDIVTDLFTDMNLNVNSAVIDNWYDKDNFESKYFIVRFEYDNTTNSLIVLKDTNINFKLSSI